MKRVSSFYIHFVKKIKEITQSDDGMDEEDKKYLESIPKQNPFGLLAMVFGGAAFTFGPEYGFIPIMSLVFCLVTYRTFDKEKEDNPWTFYIGFVLSLIGLVMFLRGITHHLIV